MARQSIHNRRAGRGATGGGASWISYSDMMAALLLIFVLILTYSLYQYFTMLETKTAELEEQQALLLAQQTLLDDRETELKDLQLSLSAKQTELDEANAALLTREQLLAALQAQLKEKEAALASATVKLEEQQQALASATVKLEEQQQALALQAARIDDLVGVRTNIIRDLSSSLSAADLKATVDPNNGSIVLDSAVFFETGKSDIKEEGKRLLDRFIPVYLNVLLSDQYADYLGEIIIEGHTDSTGTYDNNLKLSQQRALQVALYVLNMPGLSRQQVALLQQILTATGRSWADLKYDQNGQEDPEASRRVEFKFSLRDSDMIEEMQRILQENDLGDTQP
ncbi:MAG: OmpA family protein [Clostridia bacterium]|nr:OmpA family protein [Clostridia bacterium]